jgi:hypothetical protein
LMSQAIATTMASLLSDACPYSWGYIAHLLTPESRNPR